MAQDEGGMKEIEMRMKRNEEDGDMEARRDENEEKTRTIEDTETGMKRERRGKK